MVQVGEQKAFGGRRNRLYYDSCMSYLQAMFLCTLVYITVGVCGYTAFKDRYHLCLQICTCAYISATVRPYASHARVTHYMHPLSHTPSCLMQPVVHPIPALLVLSYDMEHSHLQIGS